MAAPVIPNVQLNNDGCSFTVDIGGVQKIFDVYDRQGRLVRQLPPMVDWQAIVTRILIAPEIQQNMNTIAEIDLSISGDRDTIRSVSYITTGDNRPKMLQDQTRDEINLIFRRNRILLDQYNLRDRNHVHPNNNFNLDDFDLVNQPLTEEERQRRVLQQYGLDVHPNNNFAL